MEPDVSIETSSMIRIAVIPIGTIHSHQFRDYVAMLGRHHNIELSAISSFYTVHEKSPFSQQPWYSGNLRFKYVIGGSPPSPWEDFQPYRKIHGVIGICHCPSSPDLGSVLAQFLAACKGYSSSLIQRCFAFSPCDSQLEDESKKSNKLVLFPPADQRTQEFHLQTMMQDMAASLLMEFEKWVVAAKSSGTLLKTPLDSQASLSAEEAMKARKRRDARAHKTIGDYCLLAGSPVDANAHYSDALELARTIGDYFWYAGALEGGVCAFLVSNHIQSSLIKHTKPFVDSYIICYKMSKTGEKDAALVEEVKFRYNGVITHYRKSFISENAQRVSPLSFELEATLKLARYLCRPELVKEVVELLTTATDGAKSLIDTSDRLILYIEIARLFGTLGYHRKAAFFSRQVAQLYMQQESNLAASSALQVLALTTKAYRVQSRASISNETGQYLVDGGKMNHHLVVSLFESQWSTLQMVVLKEILLSAVRAGDPLAAWSAAARLIRSYYPLITPPGQNRLANALINSADRLPSGTHCSDPALPFIRLHSFPLHFSQMDIIKRNPKREDWWAGSAPSGPFIYTPFSKRDAVSNSKHDLIWVIGEPVQVLVELANPCGFDLIVNSIYLSVHSANFDAFPVSVTLPSSSSKVLSLSGVPTKEGIVSIPGCIVHCFGVLTEHFFKDVDNLLLGASQGLVFSDPFRCCGSAKQRNITVPNITVVPRLPLLVSHVVGGDSAMILYEGEIRELWMSLANAGTVPVEQANISLSGKNQDSVVSIGYEILKSALPLKPGAEVIIPVTLKAWQLGLDPDTANKRQVDGSSPVLLIHYAGPTGDPMPPGRRLVAPLNICVLQGLSFMKARLLSMEIPAHVGGVSENICSTDSIVKIDPFRGSWGLRFLEFELYNPTDVVFEVIVSVVDGINTNNSNNNSNNNKDNNNEFSYPKTRIDRDYTSRVLIPLEHFKLPVLDGSVLINNGGGGVKTKAELNASIKDLISKIKVRWQSGRNSAGELHIKDATQAALQTSVMDVLLPDPLTFGFRVDERKEKQDCVVANEMSRMAVIVRNNTKDCIKMSLSITCRDVAGENCIEGYNNPTVLWAGTLIGVKVEIPPLKEIKHTFSLYFMVPGEYTLLAAAVIDEPNEILRARARSTSFDEPIVCRGPPYHVRVHGIV
ncbi:trafficking protein particle complex II-specific subunit 120 homolog isoform X2 [Lactuca sativa]|uniref:trafficking protein particle complex II-specific subunit 120 homolog isoform X2 n=1 Tax=Lactuca sativa TaxID=4236 RepID=UPI000CD9BCE6|nr:trafficking protein particle complex II-specific subunit 120 homolog isoform X2 [Lactuca sativa]